ncbi:MAG TPA: STT3 domain-containing protein, partial [Candidatus Binatia bacterium]|nr:STT3 domain-containing protein [Candidatus Binatia bacterium]
MPSTLPAANGLAQKVVEMRIREEIAPHIMSHFPAEQWADRLEAAVQEKLSENSAQFVAEQQRTVNEIKSELTFTGGDGRRYAYLGDYDSYVWLRNARNYLTTGTTCDAIVGGECRDTYGNAPVGYRMIYNRSLHIAAIVAAHRAMNFFRPGYPLPASAFLVPIILGALGALPAFFIARRVGGNTAAIVAAVTISLDPIYLVRSIGSDNDVWNVVMPLYIAWLLIAALSAHSAARAALFAAFAGVATGIYAAVWRGWIFACLVFLCAALGCFLLAALRRAAAGGWRSSLRSAGARAAAVSVVVYGLTSAVLGSLTAPSVFLVSPT